ncbi:MAG TPA: hypothetical protein VFZ25_17105 [Chloroflexota bacterium]|nr:hypothetical protein [Chloroflexota bacterium]
MSQQSPGAAVARAAPADAIRIVPVFGVHQIAAPVAGAPPQPAPQLIYNGGPLLTTVKVFTVFWGSAWQQSPPSDLRTQLNQFFDNILSSPLIDQLAEYSVPGFTIGPGTRTGAATVTDSEPPIALGDQQIQQMLQQAIGTSPDFPQPDANSLYFVYLPPGVTVSMGGSRSCQAFCGYHDTINNGQIFYAVMPYPGCAGCTGGLSTFDALTATSSHELCEAITDPIPGQGWYDQVHGEIGDICAWQFKRVGQYNVQLEWSNAASQCV